MSDLRVHAIDFRNGHTGFAEVAHGDQCVSLMVSRDDRFVGGLVLDPAGARLLAQVLTEQADHAERPG